MYIDDCIIGTKMVFNSQSTDVFNLGSDEQVSINQMIDIIENIAEYKVERNYQLDKPKGVRGRSSDNDKLQSNFNWKPNIKLYDGLKITYKWIYKQIVSGENSQKFTRGY